MLMRQCCVKIFRGGKDGKLIKWEDAGIDASEVKPYIYPEGFSPTPEELADPDQLYASWLNTREASLVARIERTYRNYPILGTETIPF